VPTDETGPVLSEEIGDDVACAEEKTPPHPYLRRNMTVMVMIESIWATGASDMVLAVSPLLAYLGASYTMVGFVGGLMWTGFIGSILSPYINRRFAYKKYYYVVVSLVTITPILLLGLGVVFSKHFALSGQSLLYFTVACIVGYNVFAGFCQLPHQEFLAACIPMNYRGRMFGLSMSVSNVTSIGAQSLAAWILKMIVKPVCFGYIFLLTWMIWAFGYVLAAFAIEPRPSPIEKVAKPWSREMFASVWGDRPYLRYMVLAALSTITYGSFAGMVGYYGLKDLKMPAEYIAYLGIIQKVVGIGFTAPAGLLIDKFGPKKVYPYTVLGAAISCLIVFAMPSVKGIFVATVVTSVVVPLGAANTVFAWSIPKPEQRQGHYSVIFIVNNATWLVGPLVAGRVCDVVNNFPLVMLGSQSHSFRSHAGCSSLCRTM